MEVGEIEIVGAVEVYIVVLFVLRIESTKGNMTHKPIIEYAISITLIALFLLIACDRSEPTPKEIAIDHSRATVVKVVLDTNFLETPFDASLFALSHAIGQHVYITSSNSHYGYMVHGYSFRNGFEQVLEPVIRHGRGPGEAVSISGSNKTMQSDTLVLRTRENAKLILWTSDMKSRDIEIEASVFAQMTSEFALDNGYLAFQIIPHLQSGSLIGVMNLHQENIVYGLSPRVPYGFQPEIRNALSSICPSPNGFVLSFLGDRKVYRIDYNAQVHQIMALGESDPIPNPHRIKNPTEAPGAKPYIPKMQYHNGLLHVLMDDSLYLLDLESQRVKTVIHFVNREDERMTPLEFSASGDHMIVRIGRNRFYPVQLEPDWY